jgi:hypothetical protein
VAQGTGRVEQRGTLAAFPRDVRQAWVSASFGDESRCLSSPRAGQAWATQADRLPNLSRAAPGVIAPLVDARLLPMTA